jgi:hypothetical protein
MLHVVSLDLLAGIALKNIASYLALHSSTKTAASCHDIF